MCKNKLNFPVSARALAFILKLIESKVISEKSGRVGFNIMADTGITLVEESETTTNDVEQGKYECNNKIR